MSEEQDQLNPPPADGDLWCDFVEGGQWHKTEGEHREFDFDAIDGMQAAFVSSADIITAGLSAIGEDNVILRGRELMARLCQQKQATIRGLKWATIWIDGDDWQALESKVVGVDLLHITSGFRRHTDSMVEHESRQSLTINEDDLRTDLLHVLLSPCGKR